MDRTQFEEILSSLDQMRPWELRDLALMILERFPEAETEERRRKREHVEAWATPWYTLTIVSANPVEHEEIAPRVRKLGELFHCSMAGGLKIMRSLPYEIVSRIGEYPPYCVEEFRPLKEALEALGFVVEEKYHYGHYA